MTIVGTFWCQRDGKWVRFVLENGTVRAESASRRKDNPSLAEEWKEEPEGTWPLDWSLENEKQLTKELYCLKNGTLYRDSGRVDKLLGGKLIDYYVKGSGTKTTWLGGRENPFPENQQIKNLRFSVQNLPLTVEMQEEKEKATREAREDVLVQWRTKQEHRDNFWHKYIGEVESEFEPYQVEMMLCDELSITLAQAKLQIHDYELPENFVGRWSWALNNPKHHNNPEYEAVKRAASKTSFDEDCGLNPGNDKTIREQLYEKKLAFYITLIKAGIKDVRDDCSLPKQGQPKITDPKRSSPAPREPLLTEATLEEEAINNNLSESPKQTLFDKDYKRPDKKAKLDELKGKTSSLSASQTQSINELILKLQGEVDSFWPFPNKDRKRAKIAGLNKLLAQCEDKQVGAAIDAVLKNYPDLNKGSISTRTKDLLDGLRADADQQENPIKLN